MEVTPEVALTDQVREIRRLRRAWPYIESYVEREYRRKLTPRLRTKYWFARGMRPVTRWARHLKHSWAAVNSYGSHEPVEVRRPRALQVWEHTLLWRRYGFPPDLYYALGVRPGRPEAELYIDAHMIAYLQKFLAATMYFGEESLLEDKVAFHDFCADHNLPAIPLIAAFSDGAVRRCAWPNGVAPPSDLFAKPADLYAGAGARKWVREGGLYLNKHGDRVQWSEIIRTLEHASVGRRYLLQPLVENHPDLVRLCGPGLATARIITGRAPGGIPELLSATISLPSGDSIVSHISRGGVGAMVEAGSGTLHHPLIIGEETPYTPCQEHPTTRVPIEGFQLPHWKSAVELSLRAHSALERVAFVGWDIAFTQESSLLVEGNHGFGAILPQVLSRRPLGATNFPNYFNQYLEQAQQE